MKIMANVYYHLPNLVLMAWFVLLRMYSDSGTKFQAHEVYYIFSSKKKKERVMNSLSI